MPIVAITSGNAIDGSTAPDAPPTSGRAARLGELLPSDLAGIVRRLRDHPRDAGLWGEPAFAREVDRVRRQLAPIHSRRALASSFAREAFRTARASRFVIREAAPIGPVQCAYAVRWLELGDGAPRPGWSGFVAGRD